MQTTLIKRYLVYFNYPYFQFGIHWPLNWPFPPLWLTYSLVAIIPFLIGFFLSYALTRLLN